MKLKAVAITRCRIPGSRQIPHDLICGLASAGTVVGYLHCALGSHRWQLVFSWNNSRSWDLKGRTKWKPKPYIMFDCFKSAQACRNSHNGPHFVMARRPEKLCLCHNTQHASVLFHHRHLLPLIYRVVSIFISYLVWLLQGTIRTAHTEQ